MGADGVTVGPTSSLGLLSAEPFAQPFAAVIWSLHGLMVMGEVTRRTEERPDLEASNYPM